MMKNELTNSIIMMMSMDLTTEQCQRLKNCLDIVLHQYDISKSTTEVACLMEDDNYKYLKRFEIDMRIQGLSEKSITNYVRETKKMLEFFGKNFRNITKDDISYYLAILIRKGLSNNTVDNTRKFIKAFYNWCTYNEIIERNPFLKIKCIKRSPIKKETLTEHEIESMRDACTTKRDIAMVDFLNSTGLRVSEFTSLKLNDLDLSTGKCTVFSEKTDTTRNVFLDAKALKHICDYRNELIKRGINSEYIFTRERNIKNNKPLDNNTVEKRLQKIASNANVNKHVTVHTFRKTFASKCSRKGMSPTTICSLLGHSDFTTTAKYYININNEDVKYEYDKCLN